MSISTELLARLDDAAKESHTSRSAFIAEAIQRFLRDLEEARVRQQRLQAAETVIKIADEIGPWDGTADILKWRDNH